MKNWARHQWITYSILFILLVLNFSQSLMVLIYDDLHIQTEQLRLWTILLYGLILFGSFPVIAVVIRLNQDDLQKLNIDKFYIILFIFAGLSGLYLLPYNFFAGIALIYLLYILFGGRVIFGVSDRAAPRTILATVGVCVGVVALKIGFLSHIAIIDLLGDKQSIRHALTESIPFAIYEEAVFRGMLYMFLRDLGLNETKTIYVQAVLFWAKHVNYLISAPLMFWVILPILSLIYGYIAIRSKSLTSSSIVHILYNTFVDVIK
ncbi:MAG: CPBP family intramembrane glutamic endopeptidase [Chloroflexota bacterium]